MAQDPRHFMIKDRATYSQGVPRPGTCTFDLNATPQEIYDVMGKAPAPFLKRTKQGVYIELQPREYFNSIDAGRACAGVGTPEEEFMELDHLQMVNFGVGFHVPRVANLDGPEEVAINLQLILHEPGNPLPFVIVEMYRYKDNSARIQIETLSGIQVQEPVASLGTFVEFRADQRADLFRVFFGGEEKWNTSYRSKISPRIAVGVRAGTEIKIADSARIMIVTAPEQFEFETPNPWRSICERPWVLPGTPEDRVSSKVSLGLATVNLALTLSVISISGEDELQGAPDISVAKGGRVSKRKSLHEEGGSDFFSGSVKILAGAPRAEIKRVLE